MRPFLHWDFHGGSYDRVTALIEPLQIMTAWHSVRTKFQLSCITVPSSIGISGLLCLVVFLVASVFARSSAFFSGLYRCYSYKCGDTPSASHHPVPASPLPHLPADLKFSAVQGSQRKPIPPLPAFHRKYLAFCRRRYVLLGASVDRRKKRGCQSHHRWQNKLEDKKWHSSLAGASRRGVGCWFVNRSDSLFKSNALSPFARTRTVQTSALKVKQITRPFPQSKQIYFRLHSEAYRRVSHSEAGWESTPATPRHLLRQTT